MTLALDTNVVIDLIVGDPMVRGAYVAARRARTPLAVSVFVLQELRLGSEMSSRASLQNELVDRWLEGMERVPYEVGDATIAVGLQAQLERRGRRAPYADFLIGAHAVARGFSLVTADGHDFQHIPGLELLNWRLPAEEQDLPHG